MISVVIQLLRGVVIRFINLAINRNGNISHSTLYNKTVDGNLLGLSRSNILLSTLDLTHTQHEDKRDIRNILETVVVSIQRSLANGIKGLVTYRRRYLPGSWGSGDSMVHHSRQRTCVCIFFVFFCVSVITA